MKPQPCTMDEGDFDFDWLVIGSGFNGVPPMKRVTPGMLLMKCCVSLSRIISTRM